MGKTLQTGGYQPDGSKKLNPTPPTGGSGVQKYNERGTYIYKLQTKKSVLKIEGKKESDPTYLLISGKATREQLVNFVEEEFLGDLDLRTLSFVEHYSDMELTGRETIKTLSLED